MKKHLLSLLILCGTVGIFTGCKKGGADYVAVTGITLSEYSISMEAGSDHYISATVSPENATDKEVKWSSDNILIATVSDGVISAKPRANGDCTITAKTKDGNYTATCSVHVYRAIG